MPGGLTLPGQSLPKVKTPPDLRMIQILRNWSNSRPISKLDEVAWSFAHGKTTVALVMSRQNPSMGKLWVVVNSVPAILKAAKDPPVVPGSAVDSPAAPMPLRAVCYGERSSWLHSVKCLSFPKILIVCLQHQPPPYLLTQAWLMCL